MDFLPILVRIRGRSCIVVGGGEVAARKAELLLRAGGQVRIISPTLGHNLTPMVQAGLVAHVARPFQSKDLDAAALVIAATNDDAVNRAVHAAARSRHVPVNVVDHPDLCTFVLPAIIDRSPVLIAVSSGGASPVLARLLKARLETLIPSAYGRLGILAAAFRSAVKRRFSRPVERRRFWERMLEGPVAEMMLAGREADAKYALQASLDRPDEGEKMGEVYLVGAGPGDPDLLTFRALRLMQQADVVVYDRLVSPPVLDLARRDARRIYVGKERANHVVPQEDINRLLVRLAKEGHRVVRLKGGDPFIFGRGGEEIDMLAAEKIPFQVVPGITAASGCAAYAGIPLTHRDYAQSVVFVTGHLKDGSMDLNWPTLAAPHQTVVFYMGLHGVDVLCSELIQHGRAPATPAALVQQGTTQHQRVFAATLATLPDVVEAEHIKAPTLIIIGEVVNLREKLAWFRSAADAATESLLKPVVEKTA